MIPIPQALVPLIWIVLLLGTFLWLAFCCKTAKETIPGFIPMILFIAGLWWGFFVIVPA